MPPAAVQVLPCFRRIGRLGVVLAVLCLHAPAPQMAAAQAAGSSITGMSQEDLDSDGQPDVTVLTTRLLSDGDTIRVYDGDGDMPVTSDWRAAVDFDSDVWAFDVGNDGFPQLVIQFSRTGDGLRADLFADVNADGNVDVVPSGNGITVVEAGVVFPVVSATVQGDWYLPDGHMNWNVRFTTDGGFIFDNPQLPGGIETLNFIRDFWLPFLQYDGEPDMEFGFHDDDHNGVPEYMLWRLFSDTPANVGALRARVWANTGQSVPAQPAGSGLWPFLVASGDELFGGPGYFDTPPFAGIDWATARLTPPQFHGYPIEAGFHVHNLNPFKLNEVNYANFEIGQDYYDLADDNDDLPELHIRHRYYGPNDPLAWDLRTPVSEIRYSWNQTNAPDLGWDYALGLVNTQEVTSQIDFPDFSYRAIPYADLPSWVVRNSWDISTFIAPEATRYLSTEGIYEWGPVETTAQLEGGPQSAAQAANTDLQNSLMSRYFAGEEVAVDMRRTFNQQLTNGLRGEVRYSKSGSPLVYFSPVDHKLHLLHADFGLWNFDGNSRMRYENLNSDALLDSWSVEVGGNVVARLVQAPGYLLFADSAGVTIKRTAATGASFVTRPPTTHDEWLALGAQIDAGKITQRNADLRAMFDQFEGETWTYPNAALGDVRLTETGAHFTMRASSADSAATVDSYIELNGFAPVISPHLPPHIALTFDTRSLQDEGFVSLTPAEVGVTLTNISTQDVHRVQVQLVASSEDGSTIAPIYSAALDLAAGDQQQLWFTWTPPAPGSWTIALALVDGNVNSPAQPLASETIQVAAAAQPSVEQLISLDDEQPFGGTLLIIIMACLALSVFSLSVLILRGQTQHDS